MTTTANTPESITATTAFLEEELPRLEEHQQTLEKELASVTDRLSSVRTALAALQALSGTAQLRVSLSDTETVPPPASSADAETVSDSPAPPVTAQETNATDDTSPATPGRSGTRASTTRRRAPAKKGGGQKQSSRPAKKAASAKPAKAPKTAKPVKPVKPVKTTAAKSTTGAAAPAESGGLTEQVMAILSKSGGKAVRARDVAEALGRDDTPKDINTVRSTLDRLVATSRAQRAGRGLYQAPAN
ncbi:hypothetical protein ACIHCQ_35270 [Streptomyces sp. NPDC052236]|uniref:hypothetical protein n=1 Tax=Streptomyces sp. NPDC052236 TaxID=3365686 RepID=UPI0037D60FF1